MGILLVWPAIVLSLVPSAMGIRHRAPGFLLLGAATADWPERGAGYTVVVEVR